MFPEERTEFILKRHLPMMLPLTADVFPSRFDIGMAHGKNTVTRLPSEHVIARPLLPQPERGTLLQIPHNLRDRHRPAQTKEDMGVVRFRIDLYRLAILLSQNPTHVLMQHRADLIGNQPFSALRGKHQVQMDLANRLGHITGMLLVNNPSRTGQPRQGLHRFLLRSHKHRPLHRRPGIATMNPPSVPRPLHLPSHHRLAPLSVALSATLTVFASAAEPIAPGELVAPKIEIIGGNLNFTVQPSVAGRTYLLQYSDTLQGGTWQNLGSAVIGNGNNLVLTTPHTAGTPRRFFRLALDAPPPVPEGFALIPDGPFTMGRTSGDTDLFTPPVTVTVSAFFMGKNEVTKALWDEVRTWGASNGYTDLRVGGGKASNHPVHTISWFDTVKWCNARSQKDGLTPVYTVNAGAVMKTGAASPTANWTANGYRLPTEAEQIEVPRLAHYR